MDVVPEIEETENCSVSPDQRMWQAILVVYMRDIINSINRLKGLSNGKVKKIVGRLERDYYLADSEWIETVCLVADIDYETLRTFVKETIEPYIDV
jgi:hypothetical protein